MQIVDPEHWDSPVAPDETVLWIADADVLGREPQAVAESNYVLSSSIELLSTSNTEVRAAKRYPADDPTGWLILVRGMGAE